MTGTAPSTSTPLLCPCSLAAGRTTMSSSMAGLLWVEKKRLRRWAWQKLRPSCAARASASCLFMAYAAAGFSISFHVITPDGDVKDLDLLLDLKLARSCAAALHFTTSLLPAARHIASVAPLHSLYHWN